VPTMSALRDFYYYSPPKGLSELSNLTGCDQTADVDIKIIVFIHPKTKDMFFRPDKKGVQTSL
jgi:hypothetical protein